MSDPTHDALHAERLARLTELAQRVWPDVAEYLRVENDAAQAFVRCAGGTVLLDVVAASRALDALEAALLVLAGDGGEAAMFDSGRRFERAMQKHAPWIETLAGEWEAQAIALSGSDAELKPSGAAKLVHCAAELRARAKGETVNDDDNITAEERYIRRLERALASYDDDAANDDDEPGPAFAKFVQNLRDAVADYRAHYPRKDHAP